MSSTAPPQSRAPSLNSVISMRRFTNDEVARIGSRIDADEGNEFDFLCECGDLSCTQFVTMTVAEYRTSSPGSVVGHPVLVVDATAQSEANPDRLIAVRHSPDGEVYWAFPCECGKQSCRELVFLTIDAYIALHDQGEGALADDHRLSQVERARRLRDDAQALKSQAEHQVKRAQKNLRPPLT